MRNLLLIFIATTGYLRFILYVLLVIFILFLFSFFTWWYYDAREIRLRNQTIAQQQVVSVTRATMLESKDERLRWVFLNEQRKFIELKCDYAILRESWLGRLILINRIDPEFAQ